MTVYTKLFTPSLLGKESRRFVSALSELRNDLVHDIRNSTFSLHQFVQSLDSPAVKTFATSFSPFESMVRSWPDMPQITDVEHSRIRSGTSVTEVIARVTTNPKLHIWLGARATLIEIVEMYGYSDYKRWVKATKTFGNDNEDI